MTGHTAGQDAIVAVDGLAKRFGGNVAVDGVSFDIPEGEVFGLLGPNGAGKTTIISMLSCLIAPSAGEAFVDGHSIIREPGKVKAVLGVVPQEIALYPTLTALENLRFWGRMYGLGGKLLDERVEEALELAGLADRARERIETYSGGMKRRVNIAAGIMHHPRLLIMDEPTVGIDPQSRNHILETVKELNRRGMTVIYTSHYMEEVEFLCDRVGIVDHGRLIALGELEELKSLGGDGDVLSVRVDHLPEGALSVLSDMRGVDRVTASGLRQQPAEGGDAGSAHDTSETIELVAREAGSMIGPIVTALGSMDAKVTAVEIREPNLESVFLHLTGKSLRD